jgi:CO/xanthine dehydrogenase FAD-binding subunit
MSAGSSPRATARRRERSVGTARRFSHDGEVRFAPVDVLTPRSLEEALRLKAERRDAVPIQGGTDLMVELNFDRARPAVLLNLNEVAELRGWSREDGKVWLGAGLTYAEAMEPRLADALPALAEASRTVGGPQIRNRGTIGGNLGTSSPAGDALPPLLVCGAEVKLGSVRGERVVSLEEFLVGPKQNVLAEDELIVGVTVDAGEESRQTFMKVGPRNAMVIAVVSLAVRVEGESLRAAFGSAGPVPALVRADLGDADSFPQRVAEAASPIDDVRGTAAYRRHALRILTKRALDRCLV